MSSRGNKTAAARTSVLVEVGNDWVKIAQAEPARGGVALSKLGLVRVDSFGADLADAVGSAYRALKPARLPVIALLPRQAVNIRLLELPSTDPEEIADMIELQAGKQTPYSRDEIVSDYRILGSEREGYTRIMLAIVQRNVLRQRFFTLEQAGLEVGAVSVTSEGLLNWYAEAAARGGGSSPAAVLDVDSFYSDFSVMHRGVLLFSRSILIGANQLLDDFDKHRERFVREVKQSLEICRNDLGDLGPARLIVSGAARHLPALPEALTGQLGLPVAPVDSLKTAAGLPASPSLDDEAYRGVSLTALLGAALAPARLDLNMVPESVALRGRLARKAAALTNFTGLLAAALVAATTFASVKLFLKLNRLQRLEEQQRITAEGARQVRRMQDIVNIVSQRRDTTFSAVALLSEIQRSTPEDVLLAAADFDQERGTLRLAGSGASRPNVSQLIKNLEESPLFRDVRADGPTSRNEKTGRYRFKLIGRMEKGP